MTNSDTPPTKLNEILQLFSSLQETGKAISKLAEEVRRDAVALAELRSQYSVLFEGFTDLSKLVRNGSKESLTTRVTKLEERLKTLQDCIKVQNTNKRYLVWLLFGVVGGTTLPFIYQFILNIIRHISIP